jgi:hypothetical protein
MESKSADLNQCVLCITYSIDELESIIIITGSKTLAQTQQRTAKGKMTKMS